jgi:SAM-dependent methyltransferase
MNLDGLYGGAYVDNTYGDRLKETFERIIALPPEQSDNTGRANRVTEFATQHFGHSNPLRLLDIGSGLGVFPYVMKQREWHCTALDPDPRSAQHARDVVGIDAVIGDFMTLKPDKVGQFDVLTFNKVLEHVEDPVSMLKRAREFLAPGGFVYVELPDGEAAAPAGAGREEFFIEHHHVFSVTSLSALVSRSQWSVAFIESLQEASAKYTLIAFVVP